MTFKKNTEFNREKKIHKVVKSKENKYRKNPYEYLDERFQDEDDDFDDDYSVDLDDTK